MNIVIIGPVYPFKGGIAHYTGLLATSLQKEHYVEVLSFRLQYPRFLYKKEQKDFANDAFKFENTKYLLNTLNPFSFLKVAEYIKKQKPDLAIFEWWHPYFAPSYWFILKRIKKHTKVIFTCHNVLPHEKFPLQKILTKAVLSKGDCIVHSATDAQELKRLLPETVYKQAVIPTFCNFSRLNTLQKKDAHEALQLTKTDKVLLFFGFIREYKGLKHLIQAMPDIVRQLPESKLLIVGDYFEDNKEEYIDLISQCGVEEHVRIYDGYVPDSEVALYFAACDVVILPYESATQSGIVQIAYGFNKPVIATRVGGLPDVVTDGKTGYLVPPGNSTAIADAVVRFFNDCKAGEFKENIEAEAHRFSWKKLTKIVEELAEDWSTV